MSSVTDLKRRALNAAAAARAFTAAQKSSSAEKQLSASADVGSLHTGATPFHSLRHWGWAQPCRRLCPSDPSASL